ncbi:MAG: hypothetical protein IRY85_14120 [Micromonosporaceae bacterium]|nr:hypothetical protein [Micromonosporaceae bacterium]
MDPEWQPELGICPTNGDYFIAAVGSDLPELTCVAGGYRDPDDQPELGRCPAGLHVVQARLHDGRLLPVCVVDGDRRRWS